MLMRRFNANSLRSAAAATALSSVGIGANAALRIPSLSCNVDSQFVVSTAMRYMADAKPKSPYKVLGLKPGASVAEIKKAHRIMTRKFHPDVPGGSHDKFQEIQDAYEQIKSGVWVKKGGSASDQSGEVQRSRYANFRFTQGGKRRKQSYEETYTGMHTQQKGGGVHDDFDEEPAGARKSPFGPDSVQFQAWSRLMMAWAVGFVILRIALFLTFPPKYEKAPKKKMSDRPRKPPAPKPLAPSTPVLG